MATGIFYGSNGGATERIAELIKDKLGIDADLIDIGEAEVADFDKYDKLILGSSTWGEGDLQDDWESFWEDFKGIDLSGKTVALFGVGDQEGYPDNFCDAMGTIYRQAVENGANVVGTGWSTEGYDFDESTAVVDGAFVGLCLDEDNQDDLTEERVEMWVEGIRDAFRE